jgi:deferrochelatase/peroxidase EfeB
VSWRFSWSPGCAPGTGAAERTSRPQVGSLRLGKPEFLGDQERIFGREGHGGRAGHRSRQAHTVGQPTAHGGQKILRRCYSFTDGTDPATGQLDAGLFVICFNRDPDRQFIPIQRLLAGTTR